MVTKEKMPIIQKIKKLLDKAESAAKFSTQEEAIAFMAKAQDLMQKNELELSEVEYAMAQEEDPMGYDYVTPYNKAGKAEWKRARAQWRENLAQAIARANFCTFMVNTGSNQICFVGRKSHREVAGYVWQTLCGEVERICEIEYNRAWSRHGADAARGFPAGFRAGFVQAVWRRVNEVIAQQKEELQAQSNGVALLRLDNSRSAASKWLKDSVKTHNVASLQGRYSGNKVGREIGREYGEKASLGAKGIRGSNSSGTKLLGS